MLRRRLRSMGQRPLAQEMDYANTMNQQELISRMAEGLRQQGRAPAQPMQDTSDDYDFALEQESPLAQRAFEMDKYRESLIKKLMKQGRAQQRPLAQEMDYQQAILALMEMLRSGGKGMRLR